MNVYVKLYTDFKLALLWKRENGVVLILGKGGDDASLRMIQL